MERVMHVTVVTAVLLSVGILNAVSAQSHNIELQSVCDDFSRVSCGDGWTHIDATRCVKYFQTPKSFDDAEEYCNTTGGAIVTFHSPTQMMRATCVTLHDNPEPELFWIGVIRSGEGFTYTDGSEFKNSNWYPGQPDNAGGQENCVEMNYKDWGLWNDANCAEKNNFMCIKTM
ncbi:C-type isolectin Sp-CL4-like [Pseudoliparis swirei]|uniref:C-type isolectin Sp-CL4-like n=1 Tax=Pseudoliparis swirei TaxID=2059687 RepID=UPI0024BEBFCB|nr:C-type isolectin Sp-CL4-like [Pseudoliparis swirei]